MKTRYRLSREKVDLAVFNKFNRILEENPDAMITAVEALLMKKFNIRSRTTIWHIRKRMEKRLEKKNID